MAKRKKQSKCPQAQHKPKSRPSQHDKRKRLGTPNPWRKRTVKAKVRLTGKMANLVTSMRGMLDAGMRFRLSIIMAESPLRWAVRSACCCPGPGTMLFEGLGLAEESRWKIGTN